MATWQFDLHLVPRQRPPALDEAWKTVQPTVGWAETLADRLPPTASWSTDLRVYGSEDGHRVDIWMEGPRIASIFVRIDAREPIEELAGFCAWLTSWAHSLGDTEFATAAGLIVPATASSLGEALNGSAAIRFVNDPAAFLRRVQIGGADDA
jgi:hypothetical protein